MIKQVRFDLFVYDTTHLSRDGSYWATSVSPELLPLLDRLHSRFKQTKVHATNIDSAFVGGIVVAEGKAAVVRVFDGGKDERGRLGRKVFAYLVARRELLVNVELKYLLKCQSMKALQLMARKGGRFASLDGIDLSPQIGSKVLSAGQYPMDVSAEGAFTAKTVVNALKFCESLLLSPANSLAVGIAERGDSCVGQISPFPLGGASGGITRDVGTVPDMKAVLPEAADARATSHYKMSLASHSAPTLNARIPPAAIALAVGSLFGCFAVGAMCGRSLIRSEIASVVLETSKKPTTLLAGERFTIDYKLTCTSTTSGGHPVRIDFSGRSKGGTVSTAFVNGAQTAVLKNGGVFHFSIPEVGPAYSAVIKLEGEVDESIRGDLSVALKGEASKVYPSKASTPVSTVCDVNKLCRLALRLKQDREASGRVNAELDAEGKAKVSVIVRNDGPSAASKLELFIQPTRSFALKYEKGALDRLGSGGEQAIDLELVQLEDLNPAQPKVSNDSPPVSSQGSEIQIGMRCAEPMEARASVKVLVARSQSRLDSDAVPVADSNEE